MKEFLKWLGGNENIEKVVVWILIITIGLIILNTTLMSLGLPHYQIVSENLVEISKSHITDMLMRIIVCFVNFYTIVLVIFNVKQTREILKYAITYVILNEFIYEMFGYVPTQIFILVYILAFFYYYSNRKNKYIIYAVISFFINTIIQGITYAYKASIINYENLSYITQTLLFSDYFIIMGIIIMVKEMYLKKRGVKDELVMDGRIQK